MTLCLNSDHWQSLLRAAGGKSHVSAFGSLVTELSSAMEISHLKC